jgi:hypothetical protein
MHPVLTSLNGTTYEWIKSLLFVFNEGAIGKFESLAPQFPKEVRTICDLFVISVERPNSPFWKRPRSSCGRRSVSWR